MTVHSGDVVQTKWNLDRYPASADEEYITRYATGRVVSVAGHRALVDFYGQRALVPTSALEVVEESIRLSARCIEAFKASASQHRAEILWLRPGEVVPEGYEYLLTDRDGLRHYWLINESGHS